MTTNHWGVFVCLALVFHGSLWSQATITVGGTGHVESAVWDGKSFLLASIGSTLSPTSHDGDGRILRVSAAGEILDESVLPKVKLHAPKGLAWLNGVLYLTDIDRVLGIRIADGRVVFQLSFIGVSGFLNDICIWDSNTLYVSASDKGVVFRVDLDTKGMYALQIPLIPSVNGLLADTARNRLYFNSMGGNDLPGYLGEIDLKNRIIRPLESADGKRITGSLDGLQRWNDRLYVTDWDAASGSPAIRYYDLKDASIGTFQTEGAGQGPADFCIAAGWLCLPLMKSDRVILQPIK